jgi:uncharacterized protein YkwD
MLEISGLNEIIRRLGPAATAALLTVSGSAWALDVSQSAKEVVQRTNAIRMKEGLQSLHESAALQNAARDFARYMADTGNYGHHADGRTPEERASAQGYESCILSENIAYQYRSNGYPSAGALAEAFTRGWMNSPEHRKNMLDPDVTQIGLGIARDKGGRYFAVQIFGRPKEAGIRFAVRNASGKSIEYQVGARSFSLASRATRTHFVCRPLEIRFGSSERSFTARGGIRYTVQPGGTIELDRALR